jgi:N-acetylglucosamine-6-sulfatase
MSRRSLWARGAGVAVLACALVVLVAPASRAQPTLTSVTPLRGPVGATVTVTGSGFTSASAVRIAGVDASFTIAGDGEIAAIVPSGAQAGTVEVDTADGSAVNADPFIVQPNILLIVTDDQRWDSLAGMPTVQSELAGHGVTFSNMFVTNPLCCPSRATLLTGRYSHSTGVWTNKGQFGGFKSFADDDTVATALDAEGYRTALFGKYLNAYPSTGGSYVPPGWDLWRAFSSSGPYYYNYTLSLNGISQEAHGSAPEDYSTDVLADQAAAFIQDASPQDPLFIWFAPFAPHSPFIPAPRHAGTLTGLPVWRPPSYDEADVSDKPVYIQELRPLSSARQAGIDAHRQAQLESLMAVDDAVAQLLTTLAFSGRLEDTLIVFTSDNGYLWGEHRFDGKSVPYEESIRVPLAIRWDRLPATTPTRTRLVQNLDIAPTILDAEGATLPGVDGESLVPLLNGSSSAWRTQLLFEHYGGDVPSYCAIRTKDLMFVHYSTGEEEFYRLAIDPYQLTNKIASTTAAARIDALRDAARSRCNPLPPDMPPF